MSAAEALLEGWLSARLDAPALEWLRAAQAAARGEGARARFLLAFGTAPRRTGRRDLALSRDELAAAAKVHPGLDPALWTVDQAARTLLVLALPPAEPPAYRALLDRLFDDADLGELVALYQALPLLPHPEVHRERAAEGIRANMKPVFEAIALRNPYPAEQLGEAPFNQLVLKCLFVGSPLHRVVGLDARQSRTLAENLVAYAHERWAAGRPVSPELWRGVGPFAEGPVLDDLERVLRTGTDRERAAVALAARGNERAAALLARHAAEIARASAAFPDWERIGSS